VFSSFQLEANNLLKILYEEESKDAKGVIRIRKSKNRQHNGQTNNDLQHIHIKLKIE